MKSTRLPRILSGLLVLALGISLAFNYVFFTRAEDYYYQLNQVRLDPMNLSVYPASVNQPKPAGATYTRVVFLGDSRAAMWSFPRLENVEFINRGIGSETSAQTLARYEAQVKPLGADLVILQLGINDLKTLPLFPENREAIVAACKANIAAITGKALEDDTQVVLTTVFPEGELPLERRLFWSDAVQTGIDEVNAYILSLAGKHVTVFDSAKILAGPDGLVRAEYRKDFLHLNPRGYDALNEELEKLLRTITQQ